MIHLDTSFLGDLLRETSRDRPDGAVRFIEGLDAAEVLGISVVVLCELMAGAYGGVLASLQRSGRRIGTMDLLISTAAVLDAAKLVTRNVKEFSRVPGLDVLAY